MPLFFKNLLLKENNNNQKLLPRAWTTESFMSGTSHLSNGIKSLYITEGDTIGDGDLLSAARWWSLIKLSGLELSIRSGETHL